MTCFLGQEKTQTHQKVSNFKTIFTFRIYLYPSELEVVHSKGFETSMFSRNSPNHPKLLGF